MLEESGLESCITIITTSPCALVCSTNLSEARNQCWLVYSQSLVSFQIRDLGHSSFDFENVQSVGKIENGDGT